MGDLDAMKLELTCPDCGRKFKQTVSRMKRDFDCPGCGLGFKPDQFARDIKAAEKAIKDFGRGLG